MAKKPIKPVKPLRMSAATERAMKMVARGMTRYAAAKKAGVALSTVYRCAKRLEEQQA